MTEGVSAKRVGRPPARDERQIAALDCVDYKSLTR
jgi:hypothetical protein